jgi:hypothetical protein
MTRQYVSDFSSHPAAETINDLLENGELLLADLFEAALRSSWPLLEATEALPDAYTDGVFLEQLADFYTDSAVAAFFWSDHKAVWQEAARDLEQIFQKSKLPGFISQLLNRELTQNIVIVPNISYPALQAVVARTAETLYLILPPPRAWGESPPWPYNEDPGYVVAQSCYALAETVLADVLQPLDSSQQTQLYHAAVTLCLEETMNEQESLSYLVRSKKQHNLPDLPATVEKMRAYLEDPGSGSLSDLV